MERSSVTRKTGFWEVVKSLLSGLQLTWRHFRNADKRRAPVPVMDDNYFNQPEGLVTLTYPYEAIPVPENGRYRLHNEIDDCIVCDLCAKICPVNCITIESVKATEEIGMTSDGTKKRLYAPVFDIDMAKCCYCGLCTTVCPTDCLTMTPVYDFAEVDIKNMIYHFTDLTPEKAEEKKQLLAKQQEEMAAAKAAALAARKQQG
ncbi:NADH-quinone oxidoreductase subunit I [Pontibacter sp. HSC-36F09]|uniref:NuoI/complex I 23 kDa subunit family protein n=1 Tax=Pontibacter sp. HSC-36F09 TaxID=2910966 RepID=UPI0020A16E4F|nr:NADH-quinone oxidoreductase subunit I [Pontibacter sp. HSC-36F09]MCP2045842.1 NADH-quinone oxidoreductase subunit I [Pontibacter sp. HSC-36F09]